MPSLTYNEVKQFSLPLEPRIFVETGTYMGDTTNAISPYFNKVYSIEIQPTFVINARDRFKNNTNISILEGDSSIVLTEICPTLEMPVFFWLDGHYSSDDTGKGEKDCPLLEEVKAIYDLCKQPCVIAIDDVRLFDTNYTENWLGITREGILNIVNPRVQSVKYYPSCLYSEDRMVIILLPK